MAPDPPDQAFRRFLERATEDPPAPGRQRPATTPVHLAPTPETGPDRRRHPGPQRLVLVAAALLLVAAAAATVRRIAGPAGPAPAAVSSGPNSPADPNGGPADPNSPNGAADPNGQSSPNGTGDPNGTGGTADPNGTGNPADPNGPGLGSGSGPNATGNPAPPTIPTVPAVVGVGQVPTTSASSGPASGPRGPAGSAPPGPATSAVTTNPSPGTGSPTLLRLSLDTVATDGPPGRAVTPQVGPALQIDQRGTGTIQAAPGGGRQFLPGGQQRTDYAVIGRIGPDVAALLPARGRITVSLVPLVDMAHRTVPTGRNIHTWFEIVSRDGPDHLVAGLQLNVDPEIGPYLSGAIQGATFGYVLTAADQADLAPGRPANLALEWSATTGRVTLNGRTITEIPLPANPIEWTPSARLSIGGSASWGGGYFATNDDALRSFEITAT